ncbi:MAG: response regulator transcription factor [Burkholderiales bacterium]|nr:response regulator transcription factor [Burkholderiales bacterium]
MHILVVEDDRKIAAALAAGLRRDGLEVAVAHDGVAAIELARAEPPDLVVLDLMLPRTDGLGVLETLRRRDPRLPVLIISARDALDDRIKGLDAGADDYLVKPFAFSEVAARVRALLRRGHAGEPLRLRCADLVLDVVARRVTRGEREVELTAREFELLEYLMRHRDETVSRHTLAREVWKIESRATPIDNVIEVHIARLRRKIDAAGAAPLLHTVRGVGYLLAEREP